MNPSEKFVAWLQGFAELHIGRIDEMQWHAIRNKVLDISIDGIKPKKYEPEFQYQSATPSSGNNGYINPYYLNMNGNAQMVASYGTDTAVNIQPNSSNGGLTATSLASAYNALANTGNIPTSTQPTPPQADDSMLSRLGRRMRRAGADPMAETTSNASRTVNIPDV